MERCTCGVVFAAKSSRRQFCSDACRAKHRRLTNFTSREVVCRECGASTTTEYGSPKHVYCSDACHRKYRNRRKKYKRKARKRATLTYSHVVPRDIFARDGWRCYICGVPTPPYLRGTQAYNAPELEHVVPLSKGGAHSAENLACACRRCNGAKSDQPVFDWFPALPADTAARAEAAVFQALQHSGQTLCRLPD